MNSPNTLLYEGAYDERPTTFVQPREVDAAFWQIAEGVGMSVACRDFQLTGAVEGDPEDDDGETIIRGTDLWNS